MITKGSSDCTQCGEVMVIKSRLGFMQWIFGLLLVSLCLISTIGVLEIKDFKEKFWEQRTVDMEKLAIIQTKLDSHINYSQQRRLEQDIPNRGGR